MFELVERDNNNCKYLNRNEVVIKQLKVELMRHPLHFEYETYSVYQECEPNSKIVFGELKEKIEERHTIVIDDFDQPWLCKEVNGFRFSRKHSSSIFIKITEVSGYSLYHYKINESEWRDPESGSKLNVVHCLIDSSSYLLATVIPDDVVFNCSLIRPDDSKKNCYLLGMKTIEDSYLVNFEVVATTPIRKDFRIHIKNEKGKLVSVLRVTFLVQIMIDLESPFRVSK